MTTRAKVTLSPEQETLLITLYAKAQPDNPLFFDPMAQHILNQVDYDFARLHIPYKTVVLVCQRAKKLDAVTRDFMGEHPDSVVLHLGCGLDSRFWRVDDGRVNWYDLDMPPVVDLRRQFFTGSERYQLTRSATNHPSLKYTGATIGWGMDDPCELEAWAPGLRLLEEWYFTDNPDLARLSFGYRVAYRLAGAFKMVQRAHRIVYYQL